MKLSEDQRQSLITSLLGFVRRVSFQGADSPEEAQTLPVVLEILLGLSVVIGDEEAPESESEEESENSGTCCEYEWGCCPCSGREK